MKTDLTSGIDTNIKGTLRLVGFLMLIVAFTPFLVTARRVSPEARYRWPRYFHILLSRLLGFKIRVHGKVFDQEPTFFVSNHSSYLDIPIIGSLVNGSFVAKSEVESWPLFGFLSRMQDTVFIERRAIRAGTQSGILLNRLNEGANLILFPEGTSSDGHHTLPFKSSLFSVVEKIHDEGGNIFVQPVSVVCTGIGGLPMGHLWRPYYAWYGDMILAPHLWDVMKIGDFTADVIFHPPVTIEEFGSRKKLAKHCEKEVARGVSQAVAGRIGINEQK